MINELQEELYEALAKIESMETRLCYCSTCTFVHLYRDSSVESPHKLVDTNDKDSATSVSLGHGSWDGSKYCTPPMGTELPLQIIEDSPELAGPSDEPCACTTLLRQKLQFTSISNLQTSCLRLVPLHLSPARPP